MDQCQVYSPAFLIVFSYKVWQAVKQIQRSSEVPPNRSVGRITEWRMGLGVVQSSPDLGQCLGEEKAEWEEGFCCSQSQTSPGQLGIDLINGFSLFP